MADVTNEVYDLKAKVEWHLINIRREADYLQSLLQELDKIAAKAVEPKQ